MSSRAIVALLLAVLSLSFCATSVQAQGPDIDPEDVLERCIARTRKSVKRCTNANEEQARECLRKIRILLEAGNEERARLLAAECIRDIQSRTRACVAHINEDCRECIEVLLRLEAPELARRLARACDNATDKVRQNGRRAVNAIKSAF